MKRQLAGRIRVASLEVSGLTKDDYDRWRELGDICKEVTNCVWQTWLLWHVQNGTRRLQREYLAALDEWKANGGEKPKPPVQAVPAECQKLIYATVASEFPTLNLRPVVLLINSIVGKIKTRKAAKGSLPGWVAILLCKENLPSTVRKNPIPFDVANSSIEPPDPSDQDGYWKLHVRVDRIDRGKKTATSTLDVVKLWSRGRKAAGQVAILKKIVRGEYKFCGSNLIYSESKRKWFAAICYQAPIKPAKELDKEQVAYLRPAPVSAIWQHPWKLRVPGANRAPGGRGEYIATVRRKIFAERRSRQNGYRHAGSANKGHGRDRALKPIWQLEQRWKDFVKTCNYMVAKDVVNQLIERGIGTLVYFQPSDKVRDSRFLTLTGKRDDVPESSGWDYYQVGKRLADLCQEFGVEFVWRKPSDRVRAVGEKPVKTPAKNGTARNHNRKANDSAALRSKR